MAFNPFVFPGGKPTPAASVEQSALLACLYWDSQSAAQAMIDAAGGGKILAWQFSQVSYPPSFFIWQDNSNNIGIVIVGTQNATQMTGNILSAASQPYPGSGCEVHGYWAFGLQAVLPAIFNALPADLSSTNVLVSSHSMGGAVGQLLCLDIIRTYKPLSCQFMSFGQPKPMTQGLQLAQPSPSILWQAEGDIVPELPPAQANQMFLLIGVGSGIFSLLQFYQHYGDQWTVYKNGQTRFFSNTTSTSQLSIPQVLETVAGAHYITNYFNTLLIGYQAGVTNSVTDLIIPIAQKVMAGKIGQTFSQIIEPSSYINVSGSNTTLYPGVGSPINSTNVNGVQSVTVSTNGVLLSSTTSINVQGVSMAALSGFFKFTYFYSNGQVGDAQSYCWAGSPSMTAAAAAANLLGEKLTWLLGNASASWQTNPSVGTPQIVALRISDALQSSLSQQYTLGGSAWQGWNTTYGNSAPDLANAVCNIRVKCLNSVDGTTVHWSNRHFNFFPDTVWSNGYNGVNVTAYTGTSWDQSLANLLNYICNPTNGFGSMGINVSLPVATLSTFSLVNGLLQFNAPGATWITGDTIQLFSANIKGINGKYKVILVSSGVYQIAKPLPGVVILPTLAKGRLIKTSVPGIVTKQFYSYQAPVGNWITPYGIRFSGKRNSRPFSGVSFHRPKSRTQ